MVILRKALQEVSWENNSLFHNKLQGKGGVNKNAVLLYLTCMKTINGLCTTLGNPVALYFAKLSTSLVGLFSVSLFMGCHRPEEF